MSDESIPIEFIQHRLEELDQQHMSLRREHAKVQAKLHDVRSESNALRSVLQAWHRTQLSSGKPVAAQIDAGLRGSLSPTHAVRRILQQYPGELQRSDFVDRVEPLVESESDNPRNVITTTIWRMEKRGELWADEKDRLYPASHPRAKARLQAHGREKRGMRVITRADGKVIFEKIEEEETLPNR